MERTFSELRKLEAPSGAVASRKETKSTFSAENIKTTRLSMKLNYKKLGPYRIIEKFSKINYKLALPKKSRLHFVFHVSLLEPAKANVPV